MKGLESRILTMKIVFIIVIITAVIVSIVAKRDTPHIAILQKNTSSSRLISNQVKTNNPLSNSFTRSSRVIDSNTLIKTSSTVSKTVEEILNEKYKECPPTKGTLKSLTDSDTLQLLKEFRGQPLTNKITSLWALTYLGGEDVREEFKKVLEDDYSQQAINSLDLRAIERIALGLGFLAKDDQSAYDYLVSHMRPDDWKGVRKFDISGFVKNINGIMASAMIIGIGISNREDAENVLDNVKTWDEKALILVDSSLVEAYAYLRQDRNMSRKDSVLYNVNLTRIDHLQQWFKTPEGLEKCNWYRARIKLPLLQHLR